MAAGPHKVLAASGQRKALDSLEDAQRQLEEHLDGMLVLLNSRVELGGVRVNTRGWWEIAMFRL